MSVVAPSRAIPRPDRATGSAGDAAADRAADLACCPPIGRDPLDEEQADDLAAILKALADPVRLRLVSLVATSDHDEVCACDLPALLGRSQPTVSHHLGILVRAGVLDREQRGKWAWFRLRADRLEAVAAALTATR